MEGFLSDPWSKYIPSDVGQDYYSDMARTMDFRQLNYPVLLDAGAIRITQPGSGTGPEPIINDDPEQWSLVTKHNDVQKDSYTTKWPDKPEAYENAFKMLNSPDSLYNGKYRQILWSAQQLGLSPEQVFMPQQTQPYGLLGR